MATWCQGFFNAGVVHGHGERPVGRPSRPLPPGRIAARHPFLGGEGGNPMSKSGTTREHPDLSTPIKIALQHVTIAGPDPQAAAAANAKEFFRAWMEREAKLELMFVHYGLPRTGNDAADYRALVLRMAPERFQGFEVVDVNAPPKEYKHRRRNWVTLMMLLADVEAVKREHLPRPCSDGQALQALITRRWGESSTRLPAPKNRGTLKNWLADARNADKNPALPLWRLAERCDQLPSMIKVFGTKRQPPGIVPALNR
jgi:hypothetical protein